MIASECFTKKWINNLRKSFPKTDPILLEKNIYAFQLLGLLTYQPNTFIFKGGTSVMLHIQESKRLSIDVDVLGEFSDESFQEIIENTVFTDLKVDERKEKNIPKKHFKFFYKSDISNGIESILLDTLKIDNPYVKIVKKPIRHKVLKTQKNISVIVPTIDGLTADKLTAFAPKTIVITRLRQINGNNQTAD